MKGLKLGIACLSMFVSMSIAQEQIHIGTMGTYEPWNFEKNSELQGFDIDVVKHACELKNLNCTFHKQKWESLLSSLRFGKYDLLASGLYRTNAREKVMTFGENYATPRAQFYTLTSNDIAKTCAKGCEAQLNLDEVDISKNATMQEILKAFSGKKIGVLARSAQYQFASARLPESVIVPCKSFQEMEQKVLSGDIDLGMSGSTNLTQQKGQFTTIPVEFNGLELGKGVALIFSKKSQGQLVSVFDSAIVEMRNNGKLKELSEKWFGVDISAE